MGERRQLLALLERGVSATEAARLFGVSRKTVQKWKARARKQGLEHGLEDGSRARRTQERFEGRAIEVMLEQRRVHSDWGPRTLLMWMARHPKHRHLPVPAASTLGDILRREGLVKPRRRRNQAFTEGYLAGNTKPPQQPNDRWTIDFKGDFRLGDGARCYPLTLRDAVSRMLLRIDAFPAPKSAPVVDAVRAAFEEFGLPKELHSDTGSPFGSTGLARLSRLSVFAIKHGVRPIFSRRGKPQDNGGHERMHRDLKLATALPPAEDMAAQQRRFDAFRSMFNEERPHHALDGEVPADRWTSSPRVFPRTPAEPRYPHYWEQRGISVDGDLTWQSQKVLVARALHRERVGLEPIDDGLWRVHFYDFVLGFLDERTGTPVLIGLNSEATRPPSLTSLAPAGYHL